MTKNFHQSVFKQFTLFRAKPGQFTATFSSGGKLFTLSLDNYYFQNYLLNFLNFLSYWAKPVGLTKGTKKIYSLEKHNVFHWHNTASYMKLKLGILAENAKFAVIYSSCALW